MRRSSCELIVNTLHVAPTKFIKKFVAASRSTCVWNGDSVLDVAEEVTAVVSCAGCCCC
jgi:hypothetical protein